MIKKIFAYVVSIQTLLLAAPQNPTNLVLKALSQTSVSLQWHDNATDETGFKIYRGTHLIHTTSENVTTFIDKGLTPNTTYTYTIKATDDERDIIAPTISLNGPMMIGLQIGDTYTELGATADDNVDGDISTDITITGEVDTDYAGLYLRTYTIVDAAGNHTSITRRVTVASDNIGATSIIDPKRSNIYIDLHDNTPAGATYSFESDDFVGEDEKVLTLHSSGLENSFHILGYETDVKYNWWSLPSHQNRPNISWDSKFDDDFIIYVVLKFTTAEGEAKWSDIVYTPSQNGYARYTSGFMHIFLGADAKDGNWHHYTRNIVDDLQQFYPGATIDYDANWAGYMNGIAIRGSAKITNLTLAR